jgi:hypothetical protein
MKQSSNIFNNRGQSILELAIFGSIVLLLFGVVINYGISLNQQQHLSMQTFRKALQLSKSKGWSAAPNVGASLTVVKDLPMPDPSNPFGIGETSPVIAQGSGTWSRYGGAEPEFTNSELPRINFMINGIQKTYTLGKYGHRNCYGSTIKRKKVRYGKLPADYRDKVGPCWKWESVIDYELERGDDIDIDSDGKAESVVWLEYKDDDPDEGVKEFWYMDSQEGQMDTTIDPEEGIPHGLQPEYTKDVQVDASIVKDESGSGISTTRRSTVTETIRRIIRTRAGDQTISSDVPQGQSSSWQTNW